MTLSLADKALDLKARLLALQDWSRHKSDAQALAHRRSEWNEHRAMLKRISDQLEWIGLRHAALAESQAQVKIARTLIIQAQQTLENGGVNAELTQEDRWAKTLNATEKTVSLLGDFMKIGWKKHIDDLGNFPTPATIGATLPLSRPGNRAALDAYSTVFSQYQRLARQDGPVSRDDLATLQHLTARLRELGSSFNFAEVPEAVRQFFAAIASGKGAPLLLLTNEVRDWLVAEGQAGAFIVTSAR
jgi:hypothetical protein